MNKLSSSSDALDEQLDLSGASVWAKLGSFAYRRRRGVLLAWVIVLATIIGLVGQIGSSSESSFESPDSDSSAGFEILKENFAAGGSFISGSIVYEADQGVDDPVVESTMTRLFSRLDAYDELTVTSPYSELGQQRGLVSPSGMIAYASIDFDENTDELRASEIGGEIVTLVDAIDIPGVNIEIGGAALAEFEPPESELIGVAFAIVVLILAFGSVLAMGLPIGVALFGVGIGVGTITLLTNVMSIPDFATTLGAMIGLGVGIDYALFIVTRYREGTRAGMSAHRATVQAIDTAGRAVLFAGLTVVISLLGMFVMGLAFINGLATGAAVTVLITMIASLTLLPALIGFAAHRVEVDAVARTDHGRPGRRRGPRCRPQIAAGRSGVRGARGAHRRRIVLRAETARGAAAPPGEATARDVGVSVESLRTAQSVADGARRHRVPAPAQHAGARVAARLR